MEDTFNPYVEWLGIAGARRRPNHYALLGVPLFESDSRVIAAAAERRKAALVQIQPGPREPLRQQVLAELTQARQTLTDPAQKQRYDDLLRQKAAARDAAKASAASTVSGRPRPTESRQQSSSDDLLPPRATTLDPMAPILPPGMPGVAPGDPMAPLDARLTGSAIPPSQVPSAPESPHVPPVADISDQLANARLAAHKLAVRRQKAPYWLIASMLLLLVVLGAALGVGYATGLIRIGPESPVAQNGSSRAILPPPPTPNGKPDPDTGNAATGLRHKSDMTAARPVVESASTEPDAKTDDGKARAEVTTRPDSAQANGDTTDQPPEPPIDPQQAARFTAELTAARKALGERNIEAAKVRIDAARQLAASAEQKRHLVAMQLVAKSVDDFWDAVSKGLKSVEKAGELEVGSTLVSIVEVTSEQLVIRVAGQNRRYPIDDLPAGLAVAIAKKWFDDRPQNKVVLGAFYFVDPRSDLAEARRLWEEAAGAGVDVKPLLALLPMAIDEAADAPSAGTR